MAIELYQGTGSGPITIQRQLPFAAFTKTIKSVPTSSTRLHDTTWSLLKYFSTFSGRESRCYG